MSATILDTLSDGIILLDHGCLITEINRAALSMLEIDRDHVISLPLKQYIDLPPEIFDPTDILPHLHLPVILQHKSPCSLDFELTLHPISSGWLLVICDTSRRHQLEQLKDRDKFLEAALANTPNQIIILDQNRRLLYSNDPLLRLSGLPVSDWAGFNWLTLGVSAGDRLRLDDMVSEVLATGCPTKGEIKTAQNPDPIQYEVVLSPVETDTPGDLIVVATFTDISQFLLRAGDLRESREFYRRVFSEAPDPVVLTDSEGLTILVSPSFLELFQIRSEKDILGTPILDWFSPQVRDQAQKNMDLILKGFSDLAEKETLFTLQRKDNQQFIGEINARPYKEANGFPGGLIITIRDASQREKDRVQLNHANELLLRSNRELEIQNSMVTTLNEMGQSLLACDAVETACQVMANTTAKLFTGQAGSIFLKSPYSDVIKLTSAWGENPFLENDIDEHICQAIQSKSARFFCTPSLNKHTAQMNQGNSNQIEGPQVCFPLIVQDEVIGVFQLHGKPLEIHDTWLQIAGSMADKFALTIANLRLRDTLRAQAIRDPLTGLYNRRHMEESLTRELSRAKRHNHPVGIIMMDIDFFKLFNDTYLHDGGDALLRRLGRFYRSHTRGEDITCRYGGEEFILILPETTLSESFERADIMRKQISQIRLVHRGVQLGRITISAGVSCFPIHGQSGDELLRAADTALYASKNGGRNRTTLAVDPENG